jgi:hypothetical protein
VDIIARKWLAICANPQQVVVIGADELIEKISRLCIEAHISWIKHEDD